jgi:hypothetical protein
MPGERVAVHGMRTLPRRNSIHQQIWLQTSSGRSRPQIESLAMKLGADLYMDSKAKNAALARAEAAV